MGLFELLFPKKERYVNGESTFKTLTAYEPHFTTWQGEIYEQELVRASIDAIARHCSKLTVEWRGPGNPSLQKRLKRAPSEWSTWSQFLYRLATILYDQNTAVIVPVINRYGETTGVYPVYPKRCVLTEYKGVVYLRLEFHSGERAAIELDKCGIMTRFQMKSDFFGDKSQSLGPTLDLIHLQNQAIKEGVKNSSYIRFFATISNFTNAADLAAERKRFVDYNLATSADNSGFLLFPNTYKDIKQIESKPYVVDSSQQKLIQTNVFDYFGVNEKIIQNSASTEEIDAFYAGSVEPFAIQLAEVLTNMLITDTERSYGNVIEVSSNRLTNMSIGNKIKLANAMADRGLAMIDEIRDLFGMPPLPNGEGQKSPIRGEYYFVQEGKPGFMTPQTTTDEEEDEEDALST